MGQRKSDRCSDFEIRWKKWTLPYNVPNYFIFDKLLGYNYCIIVGSEWHASLYKWANQVVGFGLPLISILIMNVMIIVTIRRSTKSVLTQETVQSNRAGIENQLIKMTLMVALVSLILTMPVYVTYLYVSEYTPGSTKEIVLNRLLLYLFTDLFKLNNEVNFLLYFTISSRFRKDVKELFGNCCRRQKGTEIDKSKSTDSSDIAIASISCNQ